LGHARVVCRRVSCGILDPEPASSPTRAFPPNPSPRLRALACFFSSGVADVLASVRRLARGCDPFCNCDLFCYAVTRESRANATERRLEFCHVEQSETSLTVLPRDSLQKISRDSSLRSE